MARPTPKRSRQHQSKPQPTVFARRLKAAMDERGWTANETARRVREALGEGAKFTPANISHYRQGRSLPRPRYLEALSRAFGVNKDELLTEASPARDGNRQQHTPSSAPIELPDGSPSFHIEDRGGNAWLQINQQLPWPTAIKILEVLKGGVVGGKTA
jgi:transcriptional regulator with XRE-family HTH domain